MPCTYGTPPNIRGWLFTILVGNVVGVRKHMGAIQWANALPRQRFAGKHCGAGFPEALLESSSLIEGFLDGQIRALSSLEGYGGNDRSMVRMWGRGKTLVF
ncbi:unnamed protein product [Ostreobium quekettii]|uniref:Uncharacterized protein n=1 Tax=Ostreobium quekettii TaxID=121088 RepID=A0A8S1J7C4_9CHLO|nr:unnamed protein product [Ostreobium quekettii]